MGIFRTSKREEVRAVGRASPSVLVVRIKQIVDVQEDAEIRLRLIAEIKVGSKVAGAGRFSAGVRSGTHRPTEQTVPEFSITIGNTEIEHLSNSAFEPNLCFHPSS